MKNQFFNVIKNVVFAFPFFIAAGIHCQTTYYIDFSNSDDQAQDGTIDHPYDDFSKCSFVNSLGTPVLEHNATYLVKRGTVYNRTNYWAESSIAIDDTNITIGAYGTGDDPILNLFAFYGGGHNILIENIDFTAFGSVSFSDGSNITIRNCKFHDCDVPGFTRCKNVLIENCEYYSIERDGMVISGSDSVTLRNVYIHDINLEYVLGGYGQGDGIQMANTNNFFMYDCIIDRSNSGNKFCIIASGGSNYYFEGCHFIGPNQYTRSEPDPRGSALHLGVANFTCKNSIFEDSPIGINVKSPTCHSYNNIFIGNNVAITGGADSVCNNVFYNNGAVGGGSYFNNNIIYMLKDEQQGMTIFGEAEKRANISNIRGNSFFGGDGAVDESVVRIADPLFVDHANHDFHLQNSSPALDEGIDVGLETDFAGNPVPKTDIDIGAYQHFVGLNYNKPPVAAIDQADTLYVDPEETFNLTCAGSYDPESAGLEYSWYVQHEIEDHLGHHDLILSSGNTTGSFEITAPNFESIFRASITVNDGELYSRQDYIVVIVGDGTEVEPYDSVTPIKFTNDRFAINCGGLDYTAEDGSIYYQDIYFEGGNGVYNYYIDIEGTKDDSLYSQYRSGDFSYHIPIDNGLYTLKFGLFERFHREPGGRRFNIYTQNGLDMTFDRIDIMEKVGEQFTAFTIESVVEVTDSNLFIETVGIDDDPVISFIEIRPYVDTSGIDENRSGQVTTRSSHLSWEKVNIYPNPFNDFITIKTPLELKRATISDVKGSIIRQFICEAYNNRLDVGFLSKGVYFLTLKLKDNTTKVYRIVK